MVLLTPNPIRNKASRVSNNQGIKYAVVASLGNKINKDFNARG